MNHALLFAAYFFNIVFLPLLFIGFVRKGKSLMQGRIGPSLLQAFYDILKLLKKSETISKDGFWTFNAAPVINIAAIVTVALMVPWLGIASPITGDLFLFAYIMLLGKFFTSLSALDTGSSFGAIGASRETAISLFSETAMIAALAALSLHAHSTSFVPMFAREHLGLYSAALAGLVTAALWMASMADLSRMPFDDPATHLELTMIHEAQILENSGPNLALIEFSVALRAVVLIGMVAKVVELLIPTLSSVAQYSVTLALMLIAASVIVVSETVLVRLRWKRLPNLLSFAISAAMVACLVAAIKG